MSSITETCFITKYTFDRGVTCKVKKFAERDDLYHIGVELLENNSRNTLWKLSINGEVAGTFQNSRKFSIRLAGEDAYIIREKGNSLAKKYLLRKTEVGYNLREVNKSFTLEFESQFERAKNFIDAEGRKAKHVFYQTEVGTVIFAMDKELFKGAIYLEEPGSEAFKKLEIHGSPMVLMGSPQYAIFRIRFGEQLISLKFYLGKSSESPNWGVTELEQIL